METQQLSEGIKVALDMGVQGRFKMEAIKVSDGSVRELAPWQDNLITDTGLNSMGGWQYRDMPSDPGSNYVSQGTTEYCWVGSGSTPPAFTDTAPAAYVKHSNTVINTTTVRSNPGDARHFTGARRVFQFAVGEAQGNLTEIGLSNGRHVNPTATYKLWIFSRALIKNANGDPITVTVLPDEILQVTYEHRIYLDSAAPKTVTLMDGANSHTLVMYPYGFGRSDTFRWISADYSGYGTRFSGGSYGADWIYQLNDSTPLNQKIPAVDEDVPTPYIYMGGQGVSSTGRTVSSPPALWGSLSRPQVSTLGVNTNPQTIRNIGGFANAGNDLGFRWLGYINPVLHKAFDETLSIEFTVTWGRYTP